MDITVVVQINWKHKIFQLFKNAQIGATHRNIVVGPMTRVVMDKYGVKDGLGRVLLLLIVVKICKFMNLQVGQHQSCRIVVVNMQLILLQILLINIILVIHKMKHGMYILLLNLVQLGVETLNFADGLMTQQVQETYGVKNMMEFVLQ